MNRKAFYDNIRPKLFPSGLDQAQVDSFESMLDYWEVLKVGDYRWLAYIFATAYHETNAEMQPIEEYGKGAKRTYGVPDPQTGKIYFGRGFVQLTWRDNYQTFATRLSLDLVRKPELALSLFPAVRILVDGMVHGLFTGKSLSDYLPIGGDSDWVGARAIVNGKDRARLVANYALVFYAALAASEKEPTAVSGPVALMSAVNESCRNLANSSLQPVAAIQPAREPAHVRFLSSKIVWVNLLTIFTGGGVFTLVALTPEQRDVIAQLLVYLNASATLVLRTFFNNPK